MIEIFQNHINDISHVKPLSKTTYCNLFPLWLQLKSCLKMWILKSVLI